MKNTEIKKNDKTEEIIILLAWIALAISIIFIVLIPALLVADYASYGIGVPFGDGLQFFFQTNGFIGIFSAMWLVMPLILKRGGAIVSKIALWGLFIFSVLAASSFVANLYYLPQVKADAVLSFFATYIPILCLIINLIAILSNWNTQDKMAVNRVIMASALVSVFWTIFYCIKVFSESVLISDVQYLNMWMVITGALTIVLMSVMFYLATSSRNIFIQSFFGETKLEAEKEEFVEDITEENAQSISEGIEILEKVAEIIDEENVSTDKDE